MGSELSKRYDVDKDATGSGGHGYQWKSYQATRKKDGDSRLPEQSANPFVDLIFDPLQAERFQGCPLTTVPQSRLVNRPLSVLA